MADEKLITCSYCKMRCPPTREHVLPRSLGGDYVAPIVCEKDRLSNLDQAVAERSLIALSRVAKTPVSAFKTKLGGEHFYFDETKGYHLELEITNRMEGVLLPQLHVEPHSPWTFFIGADKKEVLELLIRFVTRKVADGNFRSIFVKVGPKEKCETTRLVVHREKDGYIRVPNAGDEVLLFELLEKLWSEDLVERIRTGYTEGTVPAPLVNIQMAIRPDDVNRGVAKIAFNMMATTLGVNFALANEFDNIRAYILGDDIRHPTTLAPDEVATDGRFVQRLESGTNSIVSTDEHAVTLFYHRPTLLAWVTLYAHHSFLVRLGEIALNDQVLEVREFSTIRKGSQALEIAEIYRRLRYGGA